MRWFPTNPRSSSTSWNVGGKDKALVCIYIGYLMTNAGLEKGGIGFLHPRQKLEEHIHWSPVDSDALAIEIKRPWARSIHKLVQAAPLAADEGGFVPSLLRAQCAWMKVTVKMHAASPVWCGITEFSFAPFSSPCSNFGSGSFSEMIPLISVAAGRTQDPVLPRRLSRYWPEWELCMCSPMPGLWS